VNALILDLYAREEITLTFTKPNAYTLLRTPTMQIAAPAAAARDTFTPLRRSLLKQSIATFTQSIATIRLSIAITETETKTALCLPYFLP
jgi:hypothetical protein